MARSTIPVLICDRCGFEVEVREQPPGVISLDAGWGRSFATETKPVHFDARPKMIGTTEVGADMCPGCTEALMAWWAEPKAPIEQPAPAKPIERVRPPFTLEDRRVAEALVATSLAAHSNAVVDAMRESPTRFLVEDAEGSPYPVSVFAEAAADVVEQVAIALKAKPEI